MKKSLDHLFGLLKTKTGVDVVLDEVYAYTIARQKGLPGHVIRMSAYREKLRTGKTDMIGLTAEEYFTEDWLRKSVDPYLSWSVMNKKTGRDCIYTLSSGPIKSVKDLKGKRFASLTAWLTVRRILAANGVNTKPQDFFGDFTFEEDPSVLYQNVVDGKIQAFHDTWQGYTFYKTLQPSFARIKPLACLEDQPLVFFALRKGADHKAAEKVLQYMLTIHRDPGIGTSRWFFLAFRGQFFRLDPGYLAKSATVYKQLEKKGWLREAREWKYRIAPKLYKQWLKTQGQSKAARGWMKAVFSPGAG